MKIRTSAVLASLVLGLLGTATASHAARMVVPAGTPMRIELDRTISTEHAVRGERWSGVVVNDVYADGRVAIPAGSRVDGVVSRTAHGTHRSRAQLDLSVREVVVDGRRYSMNAEMEPVVAGTKRAKKIGAIAGGAAVGALLGKAVGGTKGAVIGGVAGGAAGYGLTRDALRTLKLKSGTELEFTTTTALIARR